MAYCALMEASSSQAHLRARVATISSTESAQQGGQNSCLHASISLHAKGAHISETSTQSQQPRRCLWAICSLQWLFDTNDDWGLPCA